MSIFDKEYMIGLPENESVRESIIAVFDIKGIEYSIGKSGYTLFFRCKPWKYYEIKKELANLLLVYFPKAQAVFL